MGGTSPPAAVMFYHQGLIAFIHCAKPELPAVTVDDAEFYTGITTVNEKKEMLLKGETYHHPLLDITWRGGVLCLLQLSV